MARILNFDDFPLLAGHFSLTAQVMAGGDSILHRQPLAVFWTEHTGRENQIDWIIVVQVSQRVKR